MMGRRVRRQAHVRAVVSSARERHAGGTVWYV
jgi:hypothetical protein